MFFVPVEPKQHCYKINDDNEDVANYMCMVFLFFLLLIECAIRRL